MIRLLVVTGVAGLLLLSASARAQEGGLPYSETFMKCSEKAASTQETKDCIATERAVWEKRLTKAYQSLMQRYEADDKDMPLNEMFPYYKKGATRVELLRAAERAWIAFRDADCISEASAVGGGSMAGNIAGQCGMEHVIQRTLVLERLAKDE